MNKMLSASLLVLGALAMAEISVDKVVIPAAGLGTRLLPATKVMAKEMIQVVDRPAVQYIMQEIADAGCNQAIFIAGSRKTQIMAYFDAAPDIELMLERAHKSILLEPIAQLRKKVALSYVPQPVPLGLGHAVLMAKEAVGPQWFAVILPDDLIDAAEPAIGQLIRTAKKYNAAVVAVEAVPMERVSSYGVIKPIQELEPGVFEVSDFVEKPAREVAPSNLAIVGRYVFPPDIFPALEAVKPTGAGEWQLTDAIARLAKQGTRVLACKFTGTRYDVGTPQGWLQAVVGYGLRNPLYAQKLRTFIENELTVLTCQPAKKLPDSALTR